MAVLLSSSGLHIAAHTRAFEDANILHRDVSPGNIVDGPDGGYLIDWDLCKRLQPPEGSDGGIGNSDDLDHSPRRRDRTVRLSFCDIVL